MKLHFFGVRGSTPAPGADFVRYGGHTSCVGVIPEGATEPTLLLDAGTGLRAVGDRFDVEGFRGSILLTHLHLDHVMGLPFFGQGDRPESDIDVFLPAQDGQSGRDLIARWMSPPTFPITPDELRGSWRFHAIEPGAFTTAGFDVQAFDIEHKGGRTFGFRLDSDGTSIAYLPDHTQLARRSAKVDEILRGITVLVHGAQYLDSEKAIADAYGHCTVEEVVTLAKEVEAQRLVLFHHAPDRTDDTLDAIGLRHRTSIPIVVAQEGMTISAARR